MKTEVNSELFLHVVLVIDLGLGQGAASKTPNPIGIVRIILHKIQDRV